MKALDKIKNAICCLAICYSPLAIGQIILPIEVIGEVGYTKTVTVNVVNPTAVKGLWMLVNNLSYEKKASVKINNGAWVSLNNTTTAVAEPAKTYGGIGGGTALFASIKVTLPIATGALVAGKNNISFKFDNSDGKTSGYRVVRFNLVNAAGTKLLPPSTFIDENPNTWKQPVAGSAAAAAGKVLWETKNLVEGPQSSVILRAKCGDCHAKNGRDLKYFNYSNHSIIERSKFHKLSQTEGEQIASYIRSLDVPNPGRPWNPPYQPGPGLDSKPVNEWAAGAGIDWVLDKDEMAYPFIFSNGIDTASISLNKVLNVRETPVMLQFVDWNHWLPTIHPYDASFGGDAFINSPGNYLYNGEGSNKDYNFNLTDRIEAGPNGRLPHGPLYRTQEGLGSDLAKFHGQAMWHAQKFVDSRNAVTPQITWTMREVEEIISYRHWVGVKMFELLNGNDLEGLGKVMYGPKAEERSWPGLFRNLFELSPFLSGVPWADSLSIAGKNTNNSYLNNSWYHAQTVTALGNGHSGGFHANDWKYSHENLNGFRQFSLNPNIGEPSRQLLMWVKQMQLKHQNVRGAGAEDSWYGWDLFRDHDLTYLLSPGVKKTWFRTDPGVKRQIFNSLISVWLEKSASYQPSQYDRSGGDYPIEGASYVPTLNPQTGGFDGDAVMALAHGLRAEGVDCELLNKVADFGKKMWPLGNWEAVKVACSPTNYPTVKITSPANGSSLDLNNDFAVNVSATIALGNIGKVEFYNDTTLLGTDYTLPYSHNFAGFLPGSYLVMVKAYDQTGKFVTTDLLTVKVSDQESTTLLNINPVNIDFVKAGSTQIAALVANTTWTITGKPDWLTSSVLSGSGNQSISLIASANTQASRRFATLTIAGGGLTKTLQISQAGLLDDEAPTAPLLKAIKINMTSVALNWNVPTDNIGATGYEVFKDGLSLGTVADTSFTVTGLVSGVTYNLAVRARDAAGNWSLLSTPKIINIILPVNAMTVTTQHPTLPDDFEGIDKLYDGRRDRKWNNSRLAPPTWVLFAYPSPKKLVGYKMTSANDWPPSDPKDWFVQASNDGVNWVTIDTRLNESWAARHTVYSYNIPNNNYYLYYKFNFTDSQSGESIQMAEMSLDFASGGPITATNKFSDLEQISIFPNPAKAELFVKGNFLENTSYEITSIEGKSLQTGVLNGGSISISNIISGIYLIKIKTEAGDRVQRFVKE